MIVERHEVCYRARVLKQMVDLEREFVILF